MVREDQPLRCVRAGGDAGPPAGGRAPSGAGHDHGLRRLAGPVAIRDGGGAPEAGGLEGELPLALLEQRMLSASGGVRERPPAGRLAEDDVEPGRVAGDLEEHQRAPRGEQAPQVLERASDIRRRVDDVGRDHQIEGAGRQPLGQGVIGDVEWTRHAERIGGELDLGLRLVVGRVIWRFIGIVVCQHDRLLRARVFVSCCHDSVLLSGVGA